MQVKTKDIYSRICHEIAMLECADLEIDVIDINVEESIELYEYYCSTVSEKCASYDEFVEDSKNNKFIFDGEFYTVNICK